MALQMYRQIKPRSNIIASYYLTKNVNSIDSLKLTVLRIQSCEASNFFSRKPLPELWKSVMTVSNAGRKRGRGKNLQRKINLSQAIQYESKVQFPGFTSPLKRGDTYVKQRPDPAVTSGTSQIVSINTNPKKVGSQKNTDVIKTVEMRGWTSTTLRGKKLGPPPPVKDEKFSDFQSWVLETKQRTTMHPTLGRVKQVSVLAVIGNGKGTAGFSWETGHTLHSVLPRVKLACTKKLTTIERYEDRTVFHDFYARFGNAKIIVKQMPPGYGLVCHRALKVCCEAFGIKDLYAKSEGSDNVRSIIYAFWIALLKQKTHQQIAEDKKLHLVQLKGENHYFPRVIASPETVRKPEEIPSSETLDFSQYVLNGKVLYHRKKPAPFFTKLPSYERYLRKQERRRGQDNVALKLKAEYGHLRSFLTDKYPEAKVSRWFKLNKEETES